MNSGGGCSVVQSCLTLCNSMDCSMPGLPARHQLPEFTPSHVYWVDDAIQLSHLLSPPSPPALNLFQPQPLCIRWPKYWRFNFSNSPSSEYAGLISFRIDWFDLLVVNGLWRVFSSTTVWKHQLSLSSNSHLYMTTGKTTPLTTRILLLFQMNFCGWPCSWAVS